MKQAISFSEFATDDMIIRLLCRERAKYAVKNARKKGEKIREHPFSDPLYCEIASIMPPRNLWINPPRNFRPKVGSGKGVERWTRPRKLADARVYGTLKKLRGQGCNEQWSRNLDMYVGHIRRIVSGEETFTMESPKIIAKLKSRTPEDGAFIYRPLCCYSSLETKIVLSLAYRYLLDQLDGCFHSNMLFMRAGRLEGKKRHTPCYKDAIGMAESFRRKHDSQDIYVGECDIQKFFDIINHDDVLECFDRIFSEKAQRCGVDVSFYAPALRIVESYLDSYDYYRCVMKLNDQSLPMWKGEKTKHRKEGYGEAECRFKWVSDGQFISSGCYDGASLSLAKESGKLGIPQGGALSGIIVNVVMQCIDDDIVRPKDPERFFVRYCDDILLLHTDKKKCIEYLDTYIANLKKHKLVPHDSLDVCTVKGGKNGTRTRKAFWSAKSKNVYKWGSGHGDASDWIAFVGYEMRRTGEIRIRKDKIDEFCVRIAHKYHQARNAKPENAAKAIGAFSSLSEKIADYELITREPGKNRYALAQARHLDKYLKRKVGQASRHHGLPFPEDLVTFGSVVKKADTK